MEMKTIAMNSAIIVWQNHFIAITAAGVSPRVPQLCLMFHNVTLPPLPPRRGVPVPTFNVDSLVTTSTNRKCHKWHHFISGAVIKSPDNTHSAGSQTMQVALLFWDHQVGRPHVDTQVVRLSRALEQQSMPTDQPGKWATLEILLRLYSGHRGYCHRCRN